VDDKPVVRGGPVFPGGAIVVEIAEIGDERPPGAGRA